MAEALALSAPAGEVHRWPHLRTGDHTAEMAGEERGMPYMVDTFAADRGTVRTVPGRSEVRQSWD